MAARSAAGNAASRRRPSATAGGDSGATVRPQPLSATGSLPAAERRAMGERGRAFVLAHHTYPVLAARFLAAMQR